MGRRIVVTSNCQTGGLTASLAAMLPDDEVIPIAWLDAEPAGLRDLLGGADAWVSAQPRSGCEAILDQVGRAVPTYVVPSLWFRGFHPDVVHATGAGGVPVTSAAGPYNSAITLWAWLHGIGADRVLDAFTPEVFTALGYLGEFGVQVERLRTRFDGTDVDFGQWYLTVVRRGAFMLTDNHPRLDAIVELARPIATALGADARLVASQWEQLLTDGLQTAAAVWPLYPHVAESCGLPGAYVWRTVEGRLLGLDEFVHRSMSAYASVDPASVEVARFDRDRRFEQVLAPSLGLDLGGR
jgi:hypothetical protein